MTTPASPSWHRLSVNAQMQCLYVALRDMRQERPDEMTEAETAMLTTISDHPAVRKSD